MIFVFFIGHVLDILLPFGLLLKACHGSNLGSYEYLFLIMCMLFTCSIFLLDPAISQVCSSVMNRKSTVNYCKAAPSIKEFKEGEATAYPKSSSVENKDIEDAVSNIISSKFPEVQDLYVDSTYLDFIFPFLWMDEHVTYMQLFFYFIFGTIWELLHDDKERSNTRLCLRWVWRLQ